MVEQESAALQVVMADDPAAPLAVEVTRGGMVESVHRVIAAVVDRHGAARLTWGDGARPIFRARRSSRCRRWRWLKAAPPTPSI